MRQPLEVMPLALQNLQRVDDDALMSDSVCTHSPSSCSSSRCCCMRISSSL